MPSAPALSVSQQSYLLSGLLAHPTPHRGDGRSLTTFRPLDISTGFSISANGSSRVRIGSPADTAGVTEVEAIVRADIEGVRDGGDGRGRYEAHVECPPYLQHSPIPGVYRSLDNLSTHLTTLLRPLLSALPIAPLTVVPGSHAWVIRIELTIVNLSGGNVEDAAVLACHSALWDTRLARTRPVVFVAEDQRAEQIQAEAGEGLEELGIKGALKGTKGKKNAAARKAQPPSKSGAMDVDGTTARAVDFELVDTRDESITGIPLEGVDSMPVCITIWPLPQSLKTLQQPTSPLSYLIDPTLAETHVLPTAIQVLANRAGRIFGVQHSSGATVASDSQAGGLDTADASPADQGAATSGINGTSVGIAELGMGTPSMVVLKSVREASKLAGTLAGEVVEVLKRLEGERKTSGGIEARRGQA